MGTLLCLEDLVAGVTVEETLILLDLEVVILILVCATCAPIILKGSTVSVASLVIMVPLSTATAGVSI